MNDRSMADHGTLASGGLNHGLRRYLSHPLFHAPVTGSGLDSHGETVMSDIALEATQVSSGPLSTPMPTTLGMVRKALTRAVNDMSADDRTRQEAMKALIALDKECADSSTGCCHSGECICYDGYHV